MKYTRGAGTDACPDESFFRDVVRGKTSFDPFPADATARLSIVITRRGRSYVGRAELRDEKGALLWPRDFTPMEDCASEVEGLGFAVALKLDPEGPPIPEKAAPPPLPPPPPQPDRVTPPPPPPPPPKSNRPAIRLGLSGALGFGVSPATAAPGLALDVGVRWPYFSLSLEGRAFPAATGRMLVGATSVTTGLFTGALVPCGHWRVLVGCALVEVGALRGASDAQQPLSAVLFHSAAGLRAGVEVRIIDHLAVRVTGDGLLAFQQATFQINDKPAWSTPVLSGALDAGLLTFF